jgi:dienelactone hydrolase
VGAGLDLRKLGMFGFSLGGYASANTMLADERVTAGIDLDGTLQDDPVKGPLGEVARTGLDRPFLLRGDSPKFREIRFAR